MHTDDEFKQLMEDHAATYFRGEMAVANPRDYTLEELEAMSIDMDLSAVEVDEFLRQDFQSMPQQMQEAMLQMLCASSEEAKKFWEGVLLQPNPQQEEGL